MDTVGAILGAFRHTAPQTVMDFRGHVHREDRANSCVAIPPDKAEVSGSSPLRPTHLTRRFARRSTLRAGPSNKLSNNARPQSCSEQPIHDRGTGLDYRLQLVPVDQFSDRRSTVAD